MAHFPVTNSNLSAKHLGLFLREKYHLGTEPTCSLIKAGINDTYLIVSTVGKYVYRVYSYGWRSYSEIAEEIKLLNLLRQNNISISYPVAGKDNEYIYMLQAPEGERYGVLFSYADGEKLHNYSKETHFTVGSLMAQVHHVTLGKTLERITYTPRVLLVDSLKHIADFLPANNEEIRFMHAMQQQILQDLSKVDTPQLRQGIIHLDIWFDNLNITTDNKITIFDFDFCGNGWLCIDIAYYLMQLYLVEPNDVDYKSKADSFLKGYEQVAPISAEEKRILGILGVSLYFFYLGVQCQRFDNYSSVFLNETYLKRFISLRVKKYYDFCMSVTAISKA